MTFFNDTRSVLEIYALVQLCNASLITMPSADELSRSLAAIGSERREVRLSSMHARFIENDGERCV
jgi:hypothetical protein